MADPSTIQIIDISPYLRGTTEGKEAVAQQVDQICQETGFMVIMGHGIPEQLIGEMHGMARAFFRLPLEQKLAVRAPAGRGLGYEPMGTGALQSGMPPDLKEAFDMGPVRTQGLEAYYQRSPRSFELGLWPEFPVGMQALFTRYYLGMEDLAATLMRIFALALDLPEDTFDDKIDKHMTTLRVMSYPPQDLEPLPGQLRGGAHTDWGSLTILNTTEAPVGLQVFHRQQGWIDVPALPGTLIVNIGDLMAQWTNDRWVSTLHRVANPPRELAHTTRQSLIFFHQPNHDARIEVLPSCLGASGIPKYAPTTSGEHWLGKLNAYMAGTAQ